MLKETKIIEELKLLGMTEYEAKAYIGLLKDNPVTRYELGKISGVPLPKIYEILDRMVANGWVMALEGEPVKYVPLEIENFLMHFEQKFTNALTGLRSGLPQLVGGTKADYIWNIDEYGKIVKKVAEIIREARHTLYLSLWEEEGEALRNEIEAAVKKGVQAAAIVFGDFTVDGCMTYSHGIKLTLVKEERRGLLVVADNEKAVIGWPNAPNEQNSWHGVWTKNKGLVMLTREYIKHDIYVWKISKRFAKEMFRTFGADLYLLRNVMEDKTLTEGERES